MVPAKQNLIIKEQHRYSNIKAVLFDMDGTLTSSQDTIIKSYNIALDNKVKNVQSYFGPSIHDMAKKFKQEGYIDDAEKFVSKWISIYKELASNQKLIDINTVNTIKYLKEKYIVGVITSSDKECSDATLGNYKKLFNFVVNTYPEYKSKPDPEALKHILKEYRLDPKEVVYVGDSIFDIKFAKNAKTNSIGKIDKLYTKEELLKEKPDYIINKISDLEKYL